MTRLAPPVRRIASVAVLIGLVVLLVVGGILPLIQDTASLADDRAAAHQEIARTRSFARTGPTLGEAVKELESAPIWSQLLTGDSRSAVEAALFTQVRSYFAAGAAIQNVEPLPPLTRDGLTRVGVRVHGSMTIDAVRHFVERVESSPQLLRFGALTITAPPVQSTLGPAQNETLSLRAEVYGWTRAPEAST
jgi:hypothetical protein